MITGVSIAGVPLDPGTVVAEAITVLHGRSAVDDPPSPGSADLTLLTTTMHTWAVGDPLTIESDWGPLFTGTITDQRIAGHVETVERGMCAQVEIAAAGPVATLGIRHIGDEPWPQEPATDRATRILNLSAVPYVVDTTALTDVQVTPRDVDKRSALDVLSDLAADVPAALVDLPDGRVLYQPLAARTRPQFYYQWKDFPPEQEWQDFSAEATWADFDVQSPGSDAVLRIPSSAVAWEPEWQSTAAAVINSVRLGYGVPPEGGVQDEFSLNDAASVIRYGVRHYGSQTELARLEDAQTMASRILATRAWERWALGSIDVYADALDPETRAAVARLHCGDWVELMDLPQPAPAMAWAGICEGWAYREWVTGVTRHAAWTLALSDPLFSLAVPVWADHLPEHEWQDYDPLLGWDDLTDLASIGA